VVPNAQAITDEHGGRMANPGDRLRAEHIELRWHVSSRTKLADVWATFESGFEGDVLRGDRAETTLERYQIQWRKHIEPRFGKVAVQAIRTKHVTDWINDLSRQDLSSSTVTSLYRLLGLLLNHAVTDRLITETPLKGVRTKPKQRVKAPARRLTDEECSTLIEHAPEGYRTLIALLCFTGLRISEALGLTWENVDLATGTLHVELQLARKKRHEPVRRVRLKTDRSRRQVDLMPELTALLKEHKTAAFARGHARTTDFVFSTSTGQPMYFRNVSERGLDKAAKAAGLNREGVPNLTPHDLRHTAVSRWVAAGLDVVEIARQAGDTTAVILSTYAGEFDRAKRPDSIREKIAAGTSIKIGGAS
jgi:integrase